MIRVLGRFDVHLRSHSDRLISEEIYMIAQLLNREFVVRQMEAIGEEMRRNLCPPSASSESPPVNVADYATALEHLEVSLAREKQQSSGQPGFESSPPERRNDWPAELDDFAFISRDPVVSIIQSALEYRYNAPDYASQVLEEEPEDDGRRVQGDCPVVTGRRLLHSEPRRNADNRRVFEAFSETDPSWVSSLVAMGIRGLRQRHAFNSKPPEAVAMGPNARLVIVGDWGSGLPRAQKVATAMRVYIEEALREQRDTHVVHLGDVYYSGWEYEYKNRFLEQWPVRPSEAGRLTSWSLNGNHDMYSGGHAYFDFLLADVRFRKQGRSSFFRLHNDLWQIFALDTAWDDNGLKDPQAEWIKSELDRNPQRAILLSHHQLFSAYEDTPAVGRTMREKLAPVLNAGRIHAAFWGHEHRCVLYDAFHNVQYPRLIGHGGVPVYMVHRKNDPLVAPASYELRESISKGFESWAVFGFAILDFDGPLITVRYVNEFGEVHHEEQIR
ncbi:metallophosphoesterase family protein [Bradyrhizobium sp. LB13.1]